MKKINIYQRRKIFTSVLLLIVLALLIITLYNTNWNDPDYLAIFSASLNLLLWYFVIFRKYTKAKVELLPNKIIYRLLDMKDDAIIEIDKDTKISKDWKAIYFNNENQSNSISLNYMWDVESKKLYKELIAYYPSAF